MAIRSEISLHLSRISCVLKMEMRELPDVSVTSTRGMVLVAV